MFLFLRHSAAAESPVEPVQNSERTGIAAAGGIRFATLTMDGIGIPHVEGRLADGSFIILGSRPMTKKGDDGIQWRSVVSVRSVDGGQTWSSGGVILPPQDMGIDMGDGAMLFDAATQVFFYVYRFNDPSRPYYSIRVKQSRTAGETWSDHSIVHEVTPPKGRKTGLWTPRLMFTPSGRLQCYYDDGDLPEEVLGGTNSGQWAVMRTWDGQSRKWVDQVVVCRPPEGEKGPLRIAADGARTPMTFGDGFIWSPAESPIMNPNQEAPGGPRSLSLRFALSTDDGRTWSWSRGSWPALSSPPLLHENGSYFNWSWPLGAKLGDGSVLVLFRSDEPLAGEMTRNADGTVKSAKVPSRGTSHQVDKRLHYLFTTADEATWRSKMGEVEWAKGMVSSEFIIDHDIVPLHDGAALIGFNTRQDPKRHIIMRATRSP
ncbi:MAG: hypothetical protein H0V44_09695 [Planctomycetes bacterium]|nr:hypothetical protein [Planctomycetota bacterium]